MNSNPSKSRGPAPVVIGGLAVAAGAAAAYVKVVRPWYLRWGATEQEMRRVLPGDVLVTRPRLSYTRAITIRAPVEQVWQWVIQIGQNRGGLYSYEWLENLLGSNIHNAEYVMPRYQNPEIGDYIMLYPNGPAYGIAELSAPRSLVLQTVNFDTGEFTESVTHDGIHGTWSFTLDRRVDNTTRLIVRSRLDYEPSLPANVLWGIIEPINFVMERKMLQGIQERAESHRIPDTLLDRVMPEYEFRGLESEVIHATPQRIMESFSELKGSDMPLAELLGEIRYMPSRLNKRPEERVQSETFTEMIKKMGFVTLAEEPDQIVIGAIGKFHELADQQFIHVQDAQEFERFLHADYQKLAISLRVQADKPVDRCTVTLEHRTHAMSEHSRKQFSRYWIAIKPGGGFVTRQMLRAVKRHAEAPVPEKKAPLPFPSTREPAGTPLPARQLPTHKPESVAV